MQAKAVLLATGGGPTMYKYHTPSGDKSCDGLAMALRAGLPLRDMEMVQFHPTGLLAGTGTRMTGTVLEEGLRGAGGYLLNGDRQPLHAATTTRASSARRATSSRARSIPRCAPGGPRPTAASTCRCRHLGPDNVRRQFKGMVERCADCGFDLAGGLVEVVPTAHYMMGGVVFARRLHARRCAACSPPARTPAACMARTGSAATASPTRPSSAASPATRMAAWVRAEGAWRAPDEAAIDAERRAARGAFRAAARRPRADPRSALRLHVGRRRHPAHGRRLARAPPRRSPSSTRELARVGVADGDRAFNLSWHDWLNLESLIAVSRVIAAAALAREDSRGAHFREDHPATSELATSSYVVVQQQGPALVIRRERVRFTRVAPGQTVIAE